MPRHKLLVTGATGFIGTEVIKVLAPKYIVRIFSRKSVQIHNVEVIVGDLTKQKDVERAVTGVDCIVHMAAAIVGNERAINKFNVTSTKLLVEAAKKQKVKQFVFLSSENVLWPNQSSYGQSKKIGEQIVSRLRHHLILRCSVAYGRGNKINLGKVINLVKESRFVIIPGSGRHLMQPIYVKDVAHFVKNGIDKKIEGTYVIAGASRISLNEFIDTAARFIGKEVIKFHIPLWLVYPCVKLRELFPNAPIKWSQIRNLNTTRVYNIKTAVHDFGHTPTSIENGLANIFLED